MMYQNKILGHPLKEDIIKWLTDGVSVREVEKRLADRYFKKDQAHLRISSSAIQEFKKKHLNISGKVLSDIKEASKTTRAWAKQEEEKKQLELSSSYKSAVNQIAQAELDVTKEILKVFTIVESRIEALYNKLAGKDFPDKDTEKLLAMYLDQFMKVLDQHKKYVEGYREQVDVNVNVNVMAEQVGCLRNAMREIFEEVDPSLVPIFMGKLNTKMKDLVFKSEQNSSGHAAILDAAWQDGETGDLE